MSGKIISRVRERQMRVEIRSARPGQIVFVKAPDIEPRKPRDTRDPITRFFAKVFGL